jgi:hypothetical protein
MGPSTLLIFGLTAILLGHDGSRSCLPSSRLRAYNRVSTMRLAIGRASENVPGAAGSAVS